MVKEFVQKRWIIAKRRLRNPLFWVIILAAALIASLVVSFTALKGIRDLVEPPMAGQFAKLLQKAPEKNPTNVTGTLFEQTVDELSGGVIPVLLFLNRSQFCGDDSAYALNIAACVDRFDATYIAVSEEVVIDWDEARESAREAGLPEEVQRIDEWERFVAAHEFAHILQYNYRTVALDYFEKFSHGALDRRNEDMAECYAQLQRPLTDKVAQKPGDYIELEFYGFDKKQRFGLCTEEQLELIREWLAAIPYPEANRSSF